MLIIRKADSGDARQLATLAERTFRDTFSTLNTAENMDLYCRNSFSAAIQAREIANPKMITLLGEEASGLVGFTQLHRAEAPDCVSAESPGEIRRFYVVKKWHGKGVSHGLMKACLEEMHRHGSDVAWLGVWERTPRAIAFYRKFGFLEVGDHAFPMGRDTQRDMVMARSVMRS